MVNLMSLVGIRTGAPPTSTDTVRKGAIPPSFWLKRRGSSQVVSWFFGQKIQVDVSVNEIKKYGLSALLQSNVPLCYFLYYLLDNYCSENLVTILVVIVHSNLCLVFPYWSWELWSTSVQKSGWAAKNSQAIISLLHSGKVGLRS